MSNAEINSIRRGGQLPQGERPARKSQARHTAFIQQLAMLYPGLQTKGFGKAMAEIYEQQDGAFGGTIYSTFKPDAWRVCRDTATIEIHEVVVTHYPSRAALLGMGRFWFAWDAIWEDDDSLMPRAFIHHEGVATPTEIDLQYWYYEGLRDYSGRDRVSALNSELAHEIEASRLRSLA